MFCHEYKSIFIGMFRIKVGDSSFPAENGQCLTGQLVHALKRSKDLSSEIASDVFVDAKDDAEVAFYQHFNFLSPPHQTGFICPMKHVAKLF